MRNSWNGKSPWLEIAAISQIEQAGKKTQRERIENRITNRNSARRRIPIMSRRELSEKGKQW